VKGKERKIQSKREHPWRVTPGGRVYAAATRAKGWSGTQLRAPNLRPRARNAPRSGQEVTGLAYCPSQTARSTGPPFPVGSSMRGRGAAPSANRNAPMGQQHCAPHACTAIQTDRQQRQTAKAGRCTWTLSEPGPGFTGELGTVTW